MPTFRSSLPVASIRLNKLSSPPLDQLFIKKFISQFLQASPRFLVCFCQTIFIFADTTVPNMTTQLVRDLARRPVLPWTQLVEF